MLCQIQEDIDRLDGGGSAFIYAVNDDIVLKSPVTFAIPEDSSQSSQYEYALCTVCHHDDIQNERAIFSLLANAPHSNIVQAVFLEHPEGIYLRRHEPLAKRLQNKRPAALMRITWYRDMLRALVHLHQFEIAHADVRLDNFLCHHDGTAVLCDFTCSRYFGQDNPSAIHSSKSVGLNGLSQIVSDSTDRFALASVVFEIETGAKPDLIAVDGTLHISTMKTGNENLDLIIEKAWMMRYTSTIEMLGDVEILLRSEDFKTGSPPDVSMIAKLRADIEDWRSIRIWKYGNNPMDHDMPSAC